MHKPKRCLKTERESRVLVGGAFEERVRQDVADAVAEPLEVPGVDRRRGRVPCSNGDAEVTHDLGDARV